MVRAKKNPPDGRANNGGSRQGQTGRPYPQRSDLRTQKISTPPSAEYGQGERLRRAQQAVPMGGAPAAPQTAGGAGPLDLSALPHASATPTFGQPSGRPDEPITSGMSFGPGRTPQPGQRPRDFASDDMVDRLRAIYLRYPTPELAELLDQTWL